jgi:hypothetical protein
MAATARGAVQMPSPAAYRVLGTDTIAVWCDYCC